MSEKTRPLMLGYIRAHLLMTWDELAIVKANLAVFAASEGYTLGTVYTERIDRSPAAFQALMDAIPREEAKAVVVPGMHHFAVLGAPNAMKEHLQHYTGARVLEVDSHPSAGGPVSGSPNRHRPAVPNVSIRRPPT